MADIVNRATRSRMMAGIRGSNTKPELFVRRFLHSVGLRYRLHVRSLKGTPDIVLPKYCAVIFIHGCFWHGHDCRYFNWPKSRAGFWRAKILRNRLNDRRAKKVLLSDGWRVAVVWECALKVSREDSLGNMMRLIKWIKGKRGDIEID